MPAGAAAGATTVGSSAYTPVNCNTTWPSWQLSPTSSVQRATLLPLRSTPWADPSSCTTSRLPSQYRRQCVREIVSSLTCRSHEPLRPSVCQIPVGTCSETVVPRAAAVSWATGMMAI